jgi:uncharacterized protein YllA (UPF0747 family)
LIPLGRVGGYNFRYFAKDHLFTKADLINRINNIPEAQKYLPDNVKTNSLSRELLINVSKYKNNLIIFFHY